MKRLFTLLLVTMGMVTTASAYYSLPGTWDSWKVETKQFSNNTVTINLKGNTTYQFKFYNSEGNGGSGSYSGNTGTMTWSNCSNWKFAEDSNAGITTTIAGDYTFTIVGWDNSAPILSVTYPTTYTRTVTAGNYGTICLPYKATILGADIYTIVYVHGESLDNLTGISINSISDHTIDAGESYIFKATSSTLTATLEDGTYSNVVHEKSNGMTGNLSNDPLTLDGSNSYCYVIKDNTVRKVVKLDEEHNATVTVGQYRAYIDLTDFSNPYAPALNSEFIPFYDDAPSSINTVQISESKANEYFNLNGQRVAQPTKGLYIVNGKKVVLK